MQKQPTFVRGSTDRRDTLAIREGKWKCEFCGAENLGRDMKCGSCGAVRGENVKFYLDDNAAEVTDETLLNMAEAGADWHCDYCGTDNRADAGSCKQCGAPKDGMKSREEKHLSNDGTPLSGGSSVEFSENAPVKSSRKKAPAVIIAVIALAVIIGVASFLIFGGKEDVLVLDRGEWTRTVGVERQEWVEYTSWEDSVPSGASVLDRWEEQRGTEKIQTGTERVKVGTKDKGNGFFEDIYEDRPVYREQAVYDTKVRYEIVEWKEYREVKSAGGISDDPQWPDSELRYTDREGRKNETAVLFFHSTDPEQEGKVFTYDKLRPEDLASFEKGSQYPAEVIGTTVRKFLDE